MIVRIADDFDLDMIAESGQCFRWEKKDRLVYRIIAGDRCLYLSAVDNDGDSASECFELDCTPEEYDGFWREYFDLDENYAAIRGRIDPKEDPFLFRAAEHEKGIRILRQDPWEMLVSFIISQNKNIPAIRRSIELLAEACGEPKYDQRGELFYAFPTPEALAALLGSTDVDFDSGRTMLDGEDVSGWFYKASCILRDSPSIRVAFVSTDSLCQGEHGSDARSF